MVPLSAGILMNNIAGWHDARNLIDGSTHQAQFTKLIEEAGELAGNIARGKDIRDDIGDMVVVLINLARRDGHTLADCMQVAWDDIKDRRGQMIDGIFVKEDDLDGGHIQGTRPTSASPIMAEPYGNVTPEGAEFVHSDGSFYKQPDKFWRKHVDGTWIVISGQPIGHLTNLKELK